MNTPKEPSSPRTVVLAAIPTVAAWLLYLVVRVDLSENSFFAAFIAKSVGCLMILGFALALYRLPRVRHVIGAFAAVLGAVGLLALMGSAVLFLTGTRLAALQHRSVVGFVASVLATVFV